MANEHIRRGSNSYEKLKTFKYLGCLLKVRINLPLFSTVLPSFSRLFLSCRPFVVITTPTGLVENVITTKGR
jgi:hypothetical protein